jgi:hypothetical protein
MLPVAADKFIRFFNFLANMGLVLRDDPPKVIDMAGREWGDPADGLALSIRELKREDLHQVAGISVIIRNEEPRARTFNVPPWIFFCEIDGLELTPYGRQLMSPDRKGKNIEVKLDPNGAIETDLPVATIYDMRAGGEYKIQVSCRLPDQTVLRSNEITIRV